jgi:hypothetical protein
LDLPDQGIGALEKSKFVSFDRIEGFTVPSTEKTEVPVAVRSS